MSGNPAIHRRPSGDVDIALPQDDPEPPRDGPAATPNNTAGDAGYSQPATAAE
jgi:hypothetical protein